MAWLNEKPEVHYAADSDYRNSVVASLFAQTPITLHVTSVHQEDDSRAWSTGECSATKFTIEGDAEGAHKGSRVAYVLECDEYVAYKPTAHISMACVRLHANSDYDGRMFADSISFWPVEKYMPPPDRVLYSIVSEKEVGK